jgi:glucokinase
MTATDLALAFDIGGSFLKGALIDSSGRIHRQESAALPHAPDAALQALLQLAHTLTDGGRQAVQGIGIGAPGVIDHENCGIGADAGNITQLVGQNLARVFSSYAVPVRIDNDATNAARGEHLFGAARGLKNVLVITLGTGIGGGLILDGKVYSGASSYAGEFGHVIVEANGRRCTCGGYGCVEAYASAWALRLRAADLIGRSRDSTLAAKAEAGIEVTDIAEAAAAGDALARTLMDEAARMLGIALASAANLLNLSAIVIGGGIAAAGEVLFRPLGLTFRQRAMPKASADCALIPAALGNKAGLAGAAALIFTREDS